MVRIVCVSRVTELPVQTHFFLCILLGLGTVVTKKVTRPDRYTEKKLLQFDVFEYFWKKGFYITSGIKFGGHYLLLFLS